MITRHFFPILLFTLAFIRLPEVLAADDTPGAKGFSFALKKGAPPTEVRLIWENSALQAIEIREKAEGPEVQRIEVGEFETIGCDLDQENLPPGKWIGTIDHNHDGFQDIYLQVAQGSDPTYAVLLYDAKAKRFIERKALANVQGLDLSAGGGAAEAKAPARKLEDSFGVVSKKPNEPPMLTIGGAPLAKGDVFHVMGDDEKQTAYDAEIIEPAKSDGDEGQSSYKIDFITRYDSRVPEDQPFLGIAVIGAKDGITKSGGAASTSLANAPAGKRVFFRVCTSIEGVHMTAWSGKPLVGKRLWHAYYALDYDVEPTCTPKDYQE